jgi:hypothetical protein
MGKKKKRGGRGGGGGEDEDDLRGEDQGQPGAANATEVAAVVQEAARLQGRHSPNYSFK